MSDGSTAIKRVDAVMSALHGKYGEGGRIQALLKLSKIPYVDCSPETAVFCMDKIMTHLILSSFGVDVPNYAILERGDMNIINERIKEIESRLRYPLYVSASSCSSSIGANKVHNAEEMKAALRKATCECKAVPVVCGSAYKNKGIQKMIDAVVEFMPSPLDIPAIKGTDLDGNEVERHSSDEEPFSALAFKIMTDPFVGKLAFFRVYSGIANSGSYVLNATKDKKERLGRILQMHANKRTELEKVYSGDIAAAVGLKFTATGDTLCDEAHPVILESMEFPEPVIELAIEPKTKVGQGKMAEALAKLAEEDPTFKQHTDKETGQTIIAGMGELHLEIIVDRLLREFKVEANVGAPQVAYKETFTKSVEQEYKYAKQSGGRGQYGHCKVRFEPMDANGEELYKFDSEVVGGNIPKEYIPAVGDGIEEAMKADAKSWAQSLPSANAQQ